jgi:hypothetical protein
LRIGNKVIKSAFDLAWPLPRHTAKIYLGYGKIAEKRRPDSDSLHVAAGIFLAQIDEAFACVKRSRLK